MRFKKVILDITCRNIMQRYHAKILCRDIYSNKCSKNQYLVLKMYLNL